MLHAPIATQQYQPLPFEPADKGVQKHKEKCCASSSYTCQPPRITPQFLAVTIHYCTRFIKILL